MESTEKLIRENERMRTALESLKDYAASSVAGMWRQRVMDMANNGLQKVQE